MTPREHLLVLALFVRQAHLAKLLADVLKSREIMSDEDWKAFEFAASVDDLSNSALFDLMKAKYIELASQLGIPTGLENLPPLQLSSQGRS